MALQIIFIIYGFKNCHGNVEQNDVMLNLIKVVTNGLPVVLKK